MHRILLILLVAQCALNYTAISQSQQPKFVNYTTDDGLPSNDINKIHQDKRGYIWLATTNGLCRYDGVNFKAYKSDLNNPNSLLDNELYDLAEDSKGKLWIISPKGLTSFDPESGLFERFLSDEDDTTKLPLFKLVESKIFIDSRDRAIFIGYQKSYFHEQSYPKTFLFNIESNKVEVAFEIEDSILNLHGWSVGQKNIWEDNNGKLYQGIREFVEHNGKFIYNDQQSTNKDLLDNIDYMSNIDIEQYKARGFISGSLMTQTANDVAKDKRGNMWSVGQHGEVFCYLPAEKKIVYYPNWKRKDQDKNNSNFKYRSTLNSVAVDLEADILYIGRYKGGVIVVDLAAEYERIAKAKFDKYNRTLFYDFVKISNWTPQTFGTNALKDGTANEIMVDNAQNVWVAIMGQGIFKYTPSTQKFEIFQVNPLDATTIQSNDIRTFFETSSGDFYLGTGEGYYVFDRTNSKFDKGALSLNVDKKYDTRNRPITSFAEDAQGKVYLGSWAFGLFEIQPNKLTARVFTLNNTKTEFDQPGAWISDLWYDSTTNRVYNAAWSQFISFLDVDKAKVLGMVRYFKQFSEDQKNNGLKEYYGKFAFSHRIKKGSNNQLWLSGTNNEPLRLIDLATFEDVQLHFADNHPDSLRSTLVNGMHYDKSGRFWAATHNGLSLLQDDQRRWMTFGPENGLPSEIIYDILEDKAGLFWLLTGNGLVVFDPTTFKVLQIYRTTDGLPSQQLTRGYKDKSGMMYLASNNGFARFHPNKLIKNTHKPRVLLSKLEVNRREINADSAAMLSKLELVPGKRDINFYLSSDDHSLPAINQYRMQLVGYDDNWVELGTKNEVTYTSLPVGKYQLHAQTANNDGVWGDETVLLEFEIMPYWYEMVSVKIVIGLIALIIMGLYFKRYYGQKIKRIELNQKAKEEKMQLNQELTEAKYNTLVSRLKTHDISNKILSMRYFVKDKMGVNYVENLASRVRKSLSAAHHNYWSLSNELECIQQDVMLYNANIRDEVAFELNVDAEIDYDNCLLPPLSLQPFVENSLKHGLHHLEDRIPKLTLSIAEVTLDENTKCIRVIIEDNGIGIERAQEIKRGNKMEKSMAGWGSYSTPIILEAWDKFNEGVISKDESVRIENLYDDCKNPIGTRVQVDFRCVNSQKTAPVNEEVLA